MPRALVIGNSHTASMTSAWKDNEYKPIDIYWLKNKKQPDRGNIEFDDAIKLIKTLSDDDFLFISLIGTYHNIMGLIKHPIPFDFYESPDSVDRPRQDYFLIPHNVMRSEMDRMLEGSGTVKALAKSAGCVTYIISPPPPKGNHEFISTRTRAYRGTLLDSASINDAAIRAKIWRLEMNRMADWATSNSMRFLPVPAGSLSGEGYLAEEYYGSDVTHANEAYGALVLDQIAAIATGVRS